MKREKNQDNYNAGTERLIPCLDDVWELPCGMPSWCHLLYQLVWLLWCWHCKEHNLDLKALNYQWSADENSWGQCINQHWKCSILTTKMVTSFQLASWKHWTGFFLVKLLTLHVSVSNTQMFSYVIEPVKSRKPQME